MAARPERTGLSPPVLSPPPEATLAPIGGGAASRAYFLVAAPTLGLATLVVGFGAIVTTCLAVVLDAVALASAIKTLRVLGRPPLRRRVGRGKLVSGKLVSIDSTASRPEESSDTQLRLAG
jgi:hypothetical protein